MTQSVLIGLVRCIVIHPAKSTVHLSNNQDKLWENDLSKWRYQLVAHGNDLLSSQNHSLIESNEKSVIHTFNYKHLPATASNQFPVLPTSGFLLNTTTLKQLSITSCCFCLIWKVLQLCGEQCQPTWGPFLERSILFGSISDGTNLALSWKWPQFISSRQIWR